MIIRIGVPDDQAGEAVRLEEWFRTLGSSPHITLIAVWHDAEPDESGRTARWSFRVESVEIPDPPETT